MPVGVLTIVVLLFVFPRRFFNEPAAQRGPLTPKLLKRVDFLGCFLLLGSCLFITTGLQQAAIGYSFNSAFVLPLLILTAPFVISFLGWQWWVTTRRTSPEPVFPWRFCQRPARLAIMLISWTNGAILSTCVVQIPQRFITVNGMSPLAASARFLAFGAFVPFGSSVGVAMMSKLKLRPFVVTALAVSVQIVGTVFLSRADTQMRVAASQYGMQVLVGFGVGIIIGVVITMVPEQMEERDICEQHLP